MSVFLIVGIVLFLVAVGESLVLLRRVPDWRMWFPPAVLGFGAVALAARLVQHAGRVGWHPVFPAADLPDLILGILAVIAVRSLERMARERRHAQSELARAHEELERRVEERTRELAESQARFRQLAENIREGFWLADADTKELVYVNPAFERIWGRSSAELCGNPDCWLDALHPEDRLRVLRAYRTRAAVGDYAEEFRVIRRDGSERWVYDRGFPVRDPAGRVIRVAGIAEDVTERKRAEDALRQSNEELETLVQSISHDLKAPLRAIEGFAEALVEEYANELDSSAFEYLSLMKDGVERMDALLNDLLQHAQIRHGLPLGPVDLDEVVAAVLMNLGPEIERTGARVRVEGSLPVVTGHRTTLEMMLQNLVGNALKFVAAGQKPRVEVGCADEGPWHRIYVRDEGIGIDPKYHDKIFSIFERLHDRSKYPGTGVGLAIVKKAAVLHGGDVEIQSEPGRGSTFWVRLPRRAGSGAMGVA